MLTLSDNTSQYQDLGKRAVPKSALGWINSDDGSIAFTEYGNIIAYFSVSEIKKPDGGAFADAPEIEAFLGSENFFKPRGAAGTGGTNGTAQRVVRSFAIAKTNNPHYNDVMANPPTVTTGAGMPGGDMSNVYQATENDVVNQNIGISLFGGDPFPFAGIFTRFPSVSIGNNNGNIEFGKEASIWCAGFYTDAQKVAIGVLGYYKYRVLVDEQYISLSPYDFSSAGGMQYIQMVFNGSKLRKIRIEGQESSGFSQVAVTQGRKIWKLIETPKIGYVGDSYIGGTGAPVANDGLARVCADFLGLDNYLATGSGGTGYTSSSGKLKLADRLTDWTTKKLDIVVFSAGYNDANDAALQPAALALYQATRTALPNAIIVVTGIWPGGSGPSAETIAKENKIKAAFDQFADKLSAYIPISTDPTGAWVTGTGKVGTTTGTGNSDVVTSSDGVHPSTYGHIYLGTRLAGAIAEKLAAL